MDHNLSFTKSIQINSGKNAVWEALTNPDKIKIYLFGTETITSWVTGSPIVFQGEYQGQSYKDKGIIMEFEKEKILRYSYWSGFAGLEDKPENYSTISFVLEGTGQITTLTLSQVGFKNEEAMNHSSGNWGHVLSQIKELVEKH